ncbi:MAG: tetratricopeptide repeat protein [Bacteroidetes bacterium]|jgi:tetratricopeptide (TPR) repeat protein|nr:tetratricopeptide repeat protein [Bacteroidota bacterium]
MKSILTFISFFILLLLIASPLKGQTIQHVIQQGMTFYELKEYENAIHSFEQALQFPNPPRDVYTYLTSSYLLNGDPSGAVESAEKGLDEHPDFLRLKVMKGEALIQTDTEKAIPVFEEIYQTISDSGNEQVDGVQNKSIRYYLAQLYQQAAANAFQQEKLLRAEEYFYKAREFNPDSLSNHNNLAYVLIQQEKWDEAENVLDTGLEQFPDAENLLFMKAQIFEKKGESEGMANILEALYKVDPENMERAILYGKALLKNNQADKANLFFQKMMSEHPKERMLYQSLKEINRQRFNQSGLLEVLRMEKEQFPDDRKLLEEYGMELLTAQKYDEASAYFDSLATTFDEVAYAQLSARSLLYDDQFELAEQEYRKQLKRWPDSPLLLADFGRILKKNEKFDEAKDLFERYLSNQDNDKIRIEYAELLNDFSGKEKVLKPLNQTIYSGWADWILLKDQQSENISEKSVYSKVLIDFIELYESRQQLTQEEVQYGLNHLRTKQPPIFQAATELKEISNELEEMLSIISKMLSFEDALEVLETGLVEFEESALLHHQKGLLFYQHDKLERALASFEEAAQIEATSEETHLYLGHLYSEFNRFEEAVLSYERVLTLNNGHEEAYRSLIKIHQKHGELDQLCSRWLGRYHHQKQNSVLREFLIDALHRANKFEEARALLD